MVFQNSVSFMLGWLIASIILYILWYLLWYLQNIRSIYKKWWFLLALAVFVGILLGALYLSFIKDMTDFKWHFVIRIMVASFLFLVIQYALKAQRNISRLLLEKEQIQKENYRTQLRALRAQIDPHFLFNSLNTLRSMVHQQNSNSEQFIMSLSDFYRQTLKHNENTTLQLSEELAVLQSYLFLMKSRNEEAISVNINIDRSLHQFHLPTLGLQLVVENCFKHNSMTSKMPLLIEITNTDDFYIVVSNNIQPKIGNNGSSGFGLDLLRKRYELLNIEEGVLIQETADQFCVKLKLIK
jgi:LytS/YehU family sensor histidine kinase